MTSETARIVVSSSALRWSSPLRFNDPFDTPREMASGVQPIDIMKELARRLAMLVQSPPPDASRLSPRVRLIIEMARLAGADAKPEFIDAIMQSVVDQEPPGVGLDELRTIWRTFIPEFRMLCLTEDATSAPMWHHYADQLKGVVMEFACLDELDSPWLLARPVTYTTRAEDMFSAAELAELLLMPPRLREEMMLEWATFRKAPEWRDEKEWRVVSSKRERDVGNFSHYGFNPAELSAIFLGPRIKGEDREALIASSRSFPRVRVVQVEIGARGFQFKDISL